MSQFQFAIYLPYFHFCIFHFYFSFLTPLDSVVFFANFYFYSIFIFIFIPFTCSIRLIFCKAQRFSATIFQIRLSFCQARRFGTIIFQAQRFGAIIFQAQRFGATIFQAKRFGAIIFHQAQRFGAPIFQVRLKFYLAQRFRAAILQIRLDFVKRLNFRKAPKFSAKSFQACQNFSLVCLIFQRKICKCNVRTKRTGAKAKIQSKAKQKVLCVFFSSSRKIPFVKRM